MRKLKIVSDSSSDLLKLDNADFDFSPMKILTDEREFVDDRNLDINEMATYLENYKGKSRTSCPNPSDRLEAFGDADDRYYLRYNHERFIRLLQFSLCSKANL